MKELTLNDNLLKIVKEKASINNCNYRLIFTENSIDLKFSPHESHINETNWHVKNNKQGKLGLKISVLGYQHAPF